MGMLTDVDWEKRIKVIYGRAVQSCIVVFYKPSVYFACVCLDLVYGTPCLVFLVQELFSFSKSTFVVKKWAHGRGLCVLA